MNIKNMYNKMIDMTNIFGLFIPGEELDGTQTATNLDELKKKTYIPCRYVQKINSKSSKF